VWRRRVKEEGKAPRYLIVLCLRALAVVCGRKVEEEKKRKKYQGTLCLKKAEEEKK